MEIEILRFAPTLAFMAVIYVTMLRKVGEKEDEKES